MTTEQKAMDDTQRSYKQPFYQSVRRLNEAVTTGSIIYVRKYHFVKTDSHLILERKVTEQYQVTSADENNLFIEL